MTGFNIVMPGNTAEAVVSPVVKSLVEKSLPNRKGDFFEQLKKVQGVQVNSLSFIGKYNGVSENSKIITSALGIETSNNVNESNKILSEQLCQGNTPETITGNSGGSRQVEAGSIPVQDLTPVKVVSIQNEVLILANSTKQTGELESSPDISQDESQQYSAWMEQSNYPEQVILEEDSDQAVVAKMNTVVIDGIVLDGDSSNQLALSGNSIQLPEAELETHFQVFKPVEPVPGLQPELDKQLKNAADHENQPGAQVVGRPGPAQPEPTNNGYNQQGSKGPDTGRLKFDPSVVQISNQDSLVSVEGGEEVIHSQAPVEGTKEVAPIRTNPESTLEVLKPLETIPDMQSESGKQLKGVAGNETQSGAQMTGEPGTDQPEPTNNVHNQHDSKGVDVGRLKVDPPVMQTSGQDSLVLVEDGEEVVPTRTTPKVTLEKLKPLEPIPIRQPEQSKELKGVADNDNQSGAKVTVKPGTDQAEPINNIHNQYDSKGVDAGRLKVDPPVMQTSGQDSLVLAEDGKEVFPTQTTTEVTLEMLKPLETIPDMQSEQGKELKGTGHENQSGFKPAGKGMEMQISMVDDSRDSSQQPVASTIAATGEPELAKGRVPTVVDKQVEMDVRATPDRPLVQVSRVNHSSNTTQPGFEPTANDEAGEKAYSTRKEFPSVDVRKLIEFESHRFRGTKLNTFEGRENLFKEGGDENRPNLNILNRTDLEWLRSGIRNTGMDTGGRFSTNTREIIDQVVKNAELLLRANVSELKIELKPEFLGRLTIKVALEDGAVIARLIAENQQVKHMLESNLTSLKQSLESQGIKVERAEVSVQLNNGGMFDGSEDSRQYLWHEQQHSQQQSHQYWGDGIYSNEALEIMEHEGIVEGPDYGINENGNLNFLI